MMTVVFVDHRLTTNTEYILECMEYCQNGGLAVYLAGNSSVDAPLFSPNAEIQAIPTFVSISLMIS